MPSFWIQTEVGDVLELSSTTEVRVNEASTVSSNAVEEGSDLTTNVVVGNNKATFNGIISDVATLRIEETESSINGDVATWITMMRRLKNSRVPFTLYYDKRLPPWPNTVLTGFDYDRAANTGTGYNVTLSFEQVRLRERFDIEIRVVQDPPVDSDEERAGASGTLGLRTINGQGLFFANSSRRLVTDEEGNIFVISVDAEGNEVATSSTTSLANFNGIPVIDSLFNTPPPGEDDGGN